MKNTYLFLFLFIAFNSFAQLSISPVSLSANVNIEEDKLFTLYVNNSSNEMKLYWWKVIKPNGFPQNWTTQTCDGVTCYNYNFDRSPSNKPDTVFPNIQRAVTIHFDPESSEGSANICFKIYSDPQYQNEVASTDCTDLIVAGTSSSNEFDKREVLIYPNPTSDFISIKNDDEVMAVKVYDVMGRMILNQNHSVGKTYGVKNFGYGMHFIELTAFNNEKVTKKIIFNE